MHVQCAKKVVSDSPGLVDFVMGLVPYLFELAPTPNKRPFLKAEKVNNKRPASNKRPPPPPPNQTQISAHRHPTHLSE